MEPYSVWLLLCLASFTSHNVFKVHPCYSMYRYFTPFHCWIVLHCICKYKYTVCFHLLAIVNSASMNLCVHVLIWVLILSSSSYISRNKIAGLYCNFLFNFLRKHQILSHRAAAFYTPVSNTWGFQFLHILLTFFFDNQNVLWKRWMSFS